MKFTLALVCLLIVVCNAQTNPTIVYVNVNAGDDSNDCSSQSPCATIRAGLTQLSTLSADSGIMMMSPGTYGGDGNAHNILPNIPVTIQNQNPDQDVIIDGASDANSNKKGIFFFVNDASFFNLTLINTPNGITNVFQDTLLSTPNVMGDGLTFTNVTRAFRLFDCSFTLTNSNLVQTNVYLEGLLGPVTIRDNMMSYFNLHFAHAFSDSTVQFVNNMMNWGGVITEGNYVVFDAAKKNLDVNILDCTFTHNGDADIDYTSVFTIDKIPGNWWFTNTLFQTDANNEQDFQFDYRVNITIDSVYYPPTSGGSHLVFNGVHQAQTLHQDIYTPPHSLTVYNSEAGIEVDTLGGNVYLYDNILHLYIISVTKADEFYIQNCTLDRVELQTKRVKDFKLEDSIFFESTISSLLNLPTHRGRISGVSIHKRDYFLKSEGGMWDISFITSTNKIQEGDSFGSFMSFKNAEVSIAYATILNAYTRNGGGGAIYGKGLLGIEITDSVFHNCSTHSFGGAVWVSGLPVQSVHNVSQVDINNVTFSLNSAHSELDPISGGGLAVSVFGHLSIQASTFTDNESDHGGALYVSQTPLIDLFDVNFGGNDSSNNGGAIYIPSTTSATLNMNNVYFTGNEAVNGAGVSCCLGNSCGSQVFETNVDYEDNRNLQPDGVDVNCPFTVNSS